MATLDGEERWWALAVLALDNSLEAPYAFDAIAVATPAAVPRLLHAAATIPLAPQGRVNLATALGMLKDPRAGEPLTWIAQHDPEQSVRDAALHALEEIHGPEATLPLDRSDDPLIAAVIHRFLYTNITEAWAGPSSTNAPDWIARYPFNWEDMARTERWVWLPPSGGKITHRLDQDGREILPTKLQLLPPSWTAEEQAARLNRWQQSGRLGVGYVHQLTVQGRLSDPFKYAAIALILANPYKHDWTRPFYDMPWGHVAPLVHDGRRWEPINPLWRTVEGRTDFLYRVTFEPHEGEEAGRGRLFRDAKAYQRLALALHAAQATAPTVIPESIRAALAIRWNLFVTMMDRLLTEFEIHGVADVAWFVTEERHLGWRPSGS